MIPILYDKTETTFTSNGLGRLASCTRCIVTEERNGGYECEFDFPISDPKYELIQEGQIIAVTHDDNGDIQPFDIYHRTAPINGIVTFYARHISYRQIGITVEPFTASGIANAIAGIKTNSYDTNPFTYSTDKTTAGDYTVKVPSSAKALLGGTENSLLDVFGAGEYEFDKFNVYLWTRRGTDTDVQIRYRKNLADIEHDVDYTESYNGIVPYWLGMAPDPQDPETEIETLITLPEVAIMASGQTYDGRNTILPLDMSSDFEGVPTEAELRTLATQKLNAADTLKPIENITVSFVQLWQTDEYANVAPLQKVGLCDTVSVIYPELGVDKATVKVIKTVYNTLLDRYDEMELGDSLSSYAAIITANNTSAISQLEDGLQIVSSAAAQAQSDADTAKSAAISAQADAGDALIAAQNAVTQAGNAANAAAAAQNSADAAQSFADAAAAQASTANVYANSALDQLNIVQDVVGVLDLLSTNATYQLTADEDIVPGKWYFTRSGYPGGTETGSIVSFDTTPGTKATSVIADIDAAQPNNYTSVWVGGAGKNKLEVTNFTVGQSKTSNNVTCTYNADGSFTINGTSNADNAFWNLNYTANTLPIPLGATINVGFYVSSANTGLAVQGSAGSVFITQTAQSSGFNISTNATVPSSGTATWVRLQVPTSGTAINNIKVYPFWCYSSNKLTQYEPYENICPISGHTDVVVSRTGKNLLKNGVTSGSTIASVLTLTVNADKSLTVNGTTSGWQVIGNYFTGFLGTGAGQNDGVKHLPNGTYRAKVDTTGCSLQVYGTNASSGTGDLHSLGSGTDFTFTVDDTYAFNYVRLRIDAGTYTNAKVYPRIMVSTETDATYEQYNGDTYTIDLDGTRYGGTLDVTTGVLTVTHGIKTYTGANTEGWSDNSGSGYYQYQVQISDAVNSVNAFTNSFDKIAVGDRGTKTGLVSYANDKVFRFALTTSMPMSTLALWQTWLSSNNLQVVYELATPTTVQLTATEIELLAHNNIWANSGDISVTYPSTYVYTVVTNPDVSDIGNYYELVSIDEAVHDYVVSKLAVTEAGLWVQEPTMQTKILLSATDGVVLYGPEGTIIGKYGSTAQIGDAAGFHIEMDGTELGFYQASRKVAYISNNQLYITQSVVLQQMDLGITVNDGGLGQWSWKVHANGANPSRNNLNLKWIG